MCTEKKSDFTIQHESFFTTALFIRVVHAVVVSVAAQFSGDTNVVPTSPVRFQTAVGDGTVLLIWAGWTLLLSVAACRCVNTTDRAHAWKLTGWTLRGALRDWGEIHVSFSSNHSNIKTTHVTILNILFGNKTSNLIKTNYASIFYCHHNGDTWKANWYFFLDGTWYKN